MRYLKAIKRYWILLVEKICYEEKQVDDFKRNYSKYTNGYKKVAR